MAKDAERAGIVAMIAALLVPSWWVLPQVLVGLGALSVFSAGCLLWLERLQPFFAATAAAALGYQVWLVRRRPAYRRTKTVMIILWTSVATTVLVIIVWVSLWLRYR